MKTVMTLFSIIGFICSAASMANDCPNASCTSGPEVPETYFNLTAASSTFNSGQVPSPQELKGKFWELIGGIRVVAWDNTVEGYDKNGLANNDGSITQLHFNSEEDFSGKVTETVEISNLGSYSSNQGPYDSFFSAAGVCFAQHAYDRDRGQELSNESEHYNWECKLIKNGLELICRRKYVDVHGKVQVTDYSLFKS